jgi:transposase
MARQRRSYTREFKVEAVQFVTEKGYSVAEAARSLDIGETLLRSWKTAFDKEGEQAFPGNGNLPAVRCFETSRSLQPARQVNAVVREAVPEGRTYASQETAEQAGVGLSG